MRSLVTLLLLVLVGLATPSAAAAQDGAAVGGSLRDPAGEPVPGVTIAVERDGQEVGTATTGPDGTWQVLLPGPGAYDVTLDTATLPDDVVLREASAATLPEVTIRPGQQRTVLFPSSRPVRRPVPPRGWPRAGLGRARCWPG